MLPVKTIYEKFSIKSLAFVSSDKQESLPTLSDSQPDKPQPHTHTTMSLSAVSLHTVLLHFNQIITPDPY